MTLDVIGPTSPRHVLLASAGLDGRIIIWNQDQKALTVAKKMTLTTGHLTTRYVTTILTRRQFFSSPVHPDLEHGPRDSLFACPGPSTRTI